MTLFLTSSPSGCPFEPGPDIPVLDTRNHFVANLRAVWPNHAGLGLAIARQIPQLHGGSLTGESRDDTVTFTVTLPIEKSAVGKS